MPVSQKSPIGNEVKANVLQRNLEELFGFAHEHPIRSSFPAASEGSPRDIVIVDTGSAVHVCVKTTRGWFMSAAYTAI